MKTWLLCEASVYAELASGSSRPTLVKECHECAKACFALITRLVSNEYDIGSFVLNCLVHCRECSAECRRYRSEKDIQFCGIVCSLCADSLRDVTKEITVFSLN